MARIVVELTNRCNLKCQHCFSGRHGGKDDLPLSVLRSVLDEARPLGFDHISFTGGDPTLHREFAEVLRLTAEAGYRFGMVTNGQNFAKIYPLLLPYREQLSIITFSLDGATEATHDRLRGQGSYRRVMQAMSICMLKAIPFSLSMVVTAHNRHETRALAQLGTDLGSRGVRFSHLLHNWLTSVQNFDLSPSERKEVEAEIWELRDEFPIPVAMAPGYHTSSLFPCGALQLQEINVDCQGNLTKCCHLSGHGEGAGSADKMGNLADISFAAAYQKLVQESQQFHEAKRQYHADGRFSDTDFFPCWYCNLHYNKVGWLKGLPDNPWTSLIGHSNDDTERVPVTASFVQLSSILVENELC
jgi:MoaA/NifB/PqqE/SkfB family radical SAM enzyme